ncbi:MAG: AsmA family protein, partial [Prevotella sp.]|nr:AsmA family protein [Prevotella sp.]
GKIKDAVVQLANEQLNAEVAVGDFGLNLFSNFPGATLSLNDVSLSGVGDFQGDTLLKAESLSAAIDLFSLFSGNYEISKIEIDRADVYAKLLADGRANWDIVKDTTATEEESSPFKLSLDKVVIDDCNITYDDQSADMKVVLAHWDGTLSGDMDADETALKTNSTIGEVSFLMGGIPYLNRAKVAANVGLLADLKNMKFTINESDLQLNEIKAHIDGSVALVGETGIDFDLKLTAPDTQFKDILSIVPAMYTEDFKDIKTDGTVSLEAYAKGLKDDGIYPAFNLKLLVRDAMFQYPSLPKSVNNIHLDLLVENKGGSLDNTVVDVSKFSLNLGGNPFSASLNLKTPVSDPAIKAHIDGKVDLGMIKDVYPLEKGTELNGKLTANLDLATRLSAIEKEQFENVTADGKLTLNAMTYKSPDMPEVVINDAALDFTPKYVNLTSMHVKIGQNDLAAAGRLENFIAYALKDQTLKGQLDLQSNYFNANDFMGGSETAADTSSVGSFEVLKNIDFALNAAMNKVIYENITLSNLTGSISVKNGTITLNNVSANALGGACKVAGSYSTADNSAKPKVDMSLSLNKVSFAETFKSVEAIQKFAPVFEKLTGNYSMNFKFNTTLGDNVMQILSGLTGDGLLQTDEVKVEGIEALNRLSSALNLGGNSLQSFSTKNLNIPFKVEDGKITTKPFNINIGSEGKLNLEGSTSLDQSINYKGTVSLPKSMSNSLINNVGITIGGTFTSPKIGIDTKSLLSNVAGSALDKVLGGSGEGKDISSAISEEKAKQAQKLRDEAQAAADKLLSEAQEQGQKLVDAAKNPIAKVAAQAAADKLVAEAKKQGQKLVAEADAQAQKLESGE